MFSWNYSYINYDLKEAGRMTMAGLGREIDVFLTPIFFSHQNVSIVRIFTQFYSMRKSNCPVRYLMLPHLSRFD
jgi:hypothetical protein